MILTDKFCFEDLDLLIDKVAEYKYTYEGPHRTVGSYGLTELKSFLTTCKKDPEMWKEVCKYFDSMKRNQFIKGTITGVALSSVAYLIIKKCKDKAKENNKIEGDVINHEEI